MKGVVTMLQPRTPRVICRPDRITRVTHWYTRPAWVCDQDGERWPCRLARAELTEAYRQDPVALAVLMAELLPFVAAEAKTSLVDELHERFVAWTRPVPPPWAAARIEVRNP